MFPHTWAKGGVQFCSDLDVFANGTFLYQFEIRIRIKKREDHFVSPTTSLRSIYSRAGNCTVSYVHSYQVQKTCLRINYFRYSAATMAWSGFGPYHGMWHEYAQTKCIGAILTPWAMTSALGLGVITPQPELYHFISCRNIDDRCLDLQQ